MQPMISIIVPVYNAESSLKRCIESVQNQTIKEYQLVLIDDGSKDRSLDICSQYAEKDSRITVIAQKNSGVSRARNSGLDAAIGTYVAFLDSDDYVDSNMYAVMIKEIKAKEADLVTCGYYHVVGDTLERYSYNNETIENPRLLANKLVGEQRMASAVWNNLFKKSIIDEHDLRFKDISVGEDLLFLMEYLLVCKTTVRLQECYYYYVANSNSITHRLGVNDKDSLLKLLPLKYEVFERHNLIDKQFNMIFGMEYVILILKVIQMTDYREFKRDISNPDIRKHLSMKYCGGFRRLSFLIIYILYYLKMYHLLYRIVKHV